MLYDPENVVILFPLLDEEVLVFEQVFRGDDQILILDLGLVDAQSPALDELASFALALEDFAARGEQFYDVDPLVYGVGGNVEHGNSVEDGQEGRFIEFLELFCGAFAEQYLRCVNGGVVVFLAVAHDGDLACEHFLELARVGGFAMLGDELVYFIAREHGEYLYVPLGVLVGDVEPELVELVGRGQPGVEPDVPFLGFAELGAVGLGDERAGEGVSLAAGLAAYEFGPRGDVAPLVGATHLQAAVLRVVQVKVIVALQELVGELAERHTCF